MSPAAEAAMEACRAAPSRRKAKEAIKQAVTRTPWKNLDREIQEADEPDAKRTLMSLMVMKVEGLPIDRADARVEFVAVMYGDHRIANAQNLLLESINSK